MELLEVDGRPVVGTRGGREEHGGGGGGGEGDLGCRRHGGERNPGPKEEGVGENERIDGLP